MEAVGLEGGGPRRRVTQTSAITFNSNEAMQNEQDSPQVRRLGRVGPGSAGGGLDRPEASAAAAAAGGAGAAPAHGAAAEVGGGGGVPAEAAGESEAPRTADVTHKTWMSPSPRVYIDRPRES